MAALSAPVVANGTAYVSVAETGIVAIAPGGTLLWQSHANVQGSSATSLSQPTLAGGVLYATENQDVFAFDAASGTQLWHTVPTPWKSVTPQSCGSPAYAGGVLYLACTNGYVYALSAVTGTTLWYTEIPGDPLFVHAGVSGGTLYATTDYGTNALYAISLSTHATLWTFTASTAINQPVVAGGTVYTQVENKLYALNAATGKQLWSYQLTDSGLIDPFPPAVADGVVYAVSVDEVAYAINAKTGGKLWSYAAGNTLQSPPVVSDGRLYIGTGTGGLAAFGA
jgi:outer membrane protein assembly factor BamB